MQWKNFRKAKYTEIGIYCKPLVSTAIYGTVTIYPQWSFSSLVGTKAKVIKLAI